MLRFIASYFTLSELVILLSVLGMTSLLLPIGL